MRRAAIALGAAMMLGLAGCSGGIGADPGTGSPTAGPTTGTPGVTATGEQRNVTTDTLERVAFRLTTTAMGQPTTTVLGNASAGDSRMTVRRDDGTDVTTHEVALPTNWSARLVRNLDDARSPEPDTVSVASDYEETLTLTFQFEHTTVVVRDSRIDGPESPSVRVGDRPVYYSDDPELRALIDTIRSRLAHPDTP